MTHNEEEFKFTKNDCILPALQRKAYIPHVIFNCTKPTSKRYYRNQLDIGKLTNRKKRVRIIASFSEITETARQQSEMFIFEMRGEKGREGRKEEVKEGDREGVGGRERLTQRSKTSQMMFQRQKEEQPQIQKKIDVHCDRLDLQTMSRNSPHAKENSLDYKLLKMQPVNLGQSFST